MQKSTRRFLCFLQFEQKDTKVAMVREKSQGVREIQALCNKKQYFLFKNSHGVRKFFLFTCLRIRWYKKVGNHYCAWYYFCPQIVIDITNTKHIDKNANVDRAKYLSFYYDNNNPWNVTTAFIEEGPDCCLRYFLLWN